MGLEHSKAIRVEALHTEVKYLGTFVLKDFYRSLIEVLVDKGYIKRKFMRHMENFYMMKETSNPRENSSVWFWWRTSKKHEKSPFYKIQMDITAHCRFLKEKELMWEGRKVRAYKGEIQIVIETDEIIDPKGEWAEHWFLKHIRDLYVHRIWARRKDMVKNQARNDTYFVQRFLKQFLELKQFGAESEIFYKPFGYQVKGY